MKTTANAALFLADSLEETGVEEGSLDKKATGPKVEKKSEELARLRARRTGVPQVAAPYRPWPSRSSRQPE